MRLLTAFFLVAAALLLLACGGEDSITKKLVATNTPGGATATSTVSPNATSAAAPANGTCTPPDSRAARIDRYRHAAASPAPPMIVIDPNKTYIATIQTSKGTIILDLDAKNAPNTVNNFVFLACSGFYDGLTFHRVVSSTFVIQGGDPAGDGTGGPGYTIPRRDQPRPQPQRRRRRLHGARPRRNSNGSQFFITLSPQPNLDQSGYNAFGKVTEGMDVVKAIRVGDKIISVSIEER